MKFHKLKRLYIGRIKSNIWILRLLRIPHFYCYGDFGGGRIIYLNPMMSNLDIYYVEGISGEELGRIYTEVSLDGCVIRSFYWRLTCISFILWLLGRRNSIFGVLAFLRRYRKER